MTVCYLNLNLVGLDIFINFSYIVQSLDTRASTRCRFYCSALLLHQGAGSLASRLERGELNSNIDLGRLEKAATRAKTGMGHRTLCEDKKGSEVATRLLFPVELRFWRRPHIPYLVFGKRMNNLKSDKRLRIVELNTFIYFRICLTSND